MQYKYSDIFKWSSGKPVESTNGEVPVYGSNGIVGYSDVAKYENKIILGRVGAYCGSVEYCEGKFNATDNTLITTCNETLIEYKYAYYMLKIAQLNDYAGGAAQPLITQGILKHLTCDIPDIPTQKKIASILSTYDDLIEKNNRKIAILREMAEEIYKEWFVRFRFPGYKTAKFKDGIPEGWKVKRCSAISSIKAGGDAPKEYSAARTDKFIYPIYSNGISNDGLYGYTDKATIKTESVTISARGTVGFVCLRTEPYLPIVRLLSIVPNTEFISNIYLYMYLKHNTTDGYGTSQQQITVPYFKKKKILLPKQDIMFKYTKLVEPLFNGIKKLKLANENLTQQRDLLLPRLMSGKLEVKA